jgi:gamma-glutamylcyclotransferase (GGCT)/AIG2-like uncharacterized protein YtfP
MNGTRNLFVYGTLRRDTKHELFHLLARHAKFLGEAVVRGKLYDLGDYPGMIYPERGRVIGEIYAVDSPQWESVIKRLDEYEGCTTADPEPHEYKREVINAQLADGKTVPAWAYVLNRMPSRLREIDSGDYLSSRTKAPA